MHLLKINNDHIVNLEQLTHIHRSANGVFIHVAGSKEIAITLREPEATEFLKYIGTKLDHTLVVTSGAPVPKATPPGTAA
jgi:hypothetical protein